MTQSKKIALISPFLITAVNVIVAVGFGEIIGKWAFIPIIVIEWGLFLFFIFKYGEGTKSINRWLKKPKGSYGWAILALSTGLITLPLFLLHYHTLMHWTIWLPWITLAIVNPWIEEFFYRGFLLDTLDDYSPWKAVLFSTIVFAMNHAVFGINSDVNSGFTILISTFAMGIVWSTVYLKTKSLRWTILSHFLVDFFSLSAPAFLDLFETGRWS